MKKIAAIIICSLAIGAAAFVGLGVTKTTQNQETIGSAGYVLGGDKAGVKRIDFDSSAKIISQGSEKVRIKTAGGTTTVSSQSFVVLEDGSIFAMADGVILNFGDLSNNFVNNYFVNSFVRIVYENGQFVADAAGEDNPKFGDHLWKLSEEKYLIQSEELTVYLSEDKVFTVEGFVQVSVDSDGIVEILSSENTWRTIAEGCYIRTQSGVSIYPAREVVSNENFSMSLAKLSVSADDAISLAKEETRRQIVPELHITVIDGKNGEDGTGGENGTAGENGKDGKEGVGGKDGTNGKTGVSGNTGTTGTTGKTGESGGGGSNGTAGKDVLVDSSAASALPTMSFNDWNVTSNSISGSVKITDEGGFLGNMSGRHSDYPAYVTILRKDTGETVACYECTYNENTQEYSVNDSSDSVFKDFYNGVAGEVYFSTDGETLVPDTAYFITVTAYYKADDTIYSREFLRRTFYTDSAGIVLSVEKAALNSLIINAKLSSGFAESQKTANVILMTEAQAETYTVGTNDQSAYVAKYTISPSAAAASNSISVTFNGLSANTNYLVRVEVGVSGETTGWYMTNQTLNASTLKRTPLVTGTPAAVYNRVVGAVEVSRPAVSDFDSGVVEYVYTAEYLGAKGWVTETTRKLVPGQAEPVCFYVQSNVDYRFSVQMIFNDNSKEVTYSLGYSDTMNIKGSTLPPVSLNITSNEFDHMVGTISINLSKAEANLYVGAYQPLTLSIYSDSVYNQTINIVGTEPVTGYSGDEAIYTATYSKSGNYSLIGIDLDHLYRNTNYTITVYGYLDLGDGNGAVQREIGNVSFKTYVMTDLSADWSVGSSDGFIISRVLKMDSISGSETRDSYMEGIMAEGRLTVYLYSGTGYDKVYVAKAELTGANLKKVFGSGFELTEEAFDNPSLVEGNNYTLDIITATDSTYNLNALSYVNTVDGTNIKNHSTSIQANLTAPDLEKSPASQIDVTPIYNSDYKTYGAEYDEKLADDTIIGYKLQSKFNNSKRLGVDITYYVFEYKNFYNTLAAETDPIFDENVTKLYTVTAKIDSGSSEVEPIAILFGEGTDHRTSNMNVYYAGKAVVLNPTDPEYCVLKSGMKRGFRYVFAYTVRYSLNGSTDEGDLHVYPNEHPKFDDYMQAYSCGYEYDKKLGNNKNYILHSGMVEAPNEAPTIYSYVYSTQDVGMVQNSDYTDSYGTYTVHYKWRDPDGTIFTDPGKETKLYYQSAMHTEVYSKINANVLDAVNGWYSINIPYTAKRIDSTNSTSTLQDITKVTSNVALYFIDYEELLEYLRQGTADEKLDENFYFFKLSSDWSWGAYFEKKSSSLAAELETHFEDNYIRISVLDIEGGILNQIMQERSLAVEVTFKTKGIDPDTGNSYEPITVRTGLLKNTVTDQIYCDISTGNIGKFIGKQITVTMKIYYDNGNQTWELNSSDYYALQGGNITKDSITYARLGSYMVPAAEGNIASGNTNPNGGLLKLVSEIDDVPLYIRKTVNVAKVDKINRKSIGFSFQLTDKTFTFHRYVVPSQAGVDVSSDNSSVFKFTGSTIVVKEVSEYNLSFIGETEKFTLASITPSIIYGGTENSSTSVAIKAFQCAGLTDIFKKNTNKQYYVIARLYGSEFEAKNHANSYVATMNIEIDSATGYSHGNEDNFVFAHLEDGGTYYLTFIVVRKSDSQEIVCMTSSGTTQAIYEIRTSSKVVISSQRGAVYTNDDYFTKKVECTFRLSRYFGVQLRYAILDAAGNNIMITETQMRDAKIFTAPTIASENNLLSIDLTPKTDRSMFTPGKTYQLYIEAYEPAQSDDEEDKVVGEAKYSFRVSPVGNVGGVSYIKDATNEEIVFQVSCFDEQYSLMGNTNYQNGCGLFMVRFTDGQGNRLCTIYDDAVFSVVQMKQEFVLNNYTLTNKGGTANQIIKSDSTYYIYVYAILDSQHTGVSPVVDKEDNTKDCQYFFGELGSATYTVGPEGQTTTYQFATAVNFSNFLNSFWYDGGKNYAKIEDDDLADIESKFLMCSRSQLTADATGILLNENNSYLNRVDSSHLALVLSESFGVIQNNAQVFSLIEWDVFGTKDSTGMYLHYNGESSLSNGDTLFTLGTDGARNKAFLYTIPCDQLQTGIYTVTLRLYLPSNLNTPYAKLSFRLHI